MNMLLGNMGPATITERITAFQTELNTATTYDNMYLHYHTTAVGYENLKSVSVWDSAFNSTYTYTFTNVQADDTALTATATLTIVDSNSNTVDTGSVSFEFKMDDSVVMLYSFTGIDNAPILKNVK